MSTPVIKVAVTGAAGQIGYALVNLIAQGLMFGPSQRVDLSLIELPAALPSLHGVAMELDDGAYPLLNDTTCTDDLHQGMKDADWIILVGAMPRKAGMERKDLLSINANIFVEQAAAINQQAKADAKVLVVGNPCNTNCLVTLKHAPNLRPENFFAMTLLDENRAKAMLAKRYQVSLSDVHIMILGNHSSTQFPDITQATIKGEPLMTVEKDHTWLKETFIPAVQTRGAQVIKARGSSSAASAARSIAQTVAKIEGVDAPGVPFSVALLTAGQYQAPQGIITSVPVRYHQGQLEIIEQPVDDYAQSMLDITYQELLAEKQAIVDMGALS